MCSFGLQVSSFVRHVFKFAIEADLCSQLIAASQNQIYFSLRSLKSLFPVP